MVELRTEDGRVSAVVLSTGRGLRRKGRHSGHRHLSPRHGPSWASACRTRAPTGMQASLALTESLRKLGLPLRRFKTGTPPRVNARSVDFSQMEVQYGDAEPPALLL